MAINALLSRNLSVDLGQGFTNSSVYGERQLSPSSTALPSLEGRCQPRCHFFDPVGTYMTAEAVTAPFSVLPRRIRLAGFGNLG